MEEEKKMLEKAQALGIGTGHAKMIGWIHDEIASLEKLRGNYPGMGSALCALGIEKGHFVAAEIINSLKDEKGNPWLLFEQELKQPASILSSEISRLLPESSKQVYLRLKKENGPRIHFLYLLSRFDLTAEQAKVLFVKEEVYGFDVPVEELGKEFDLAILGTKGTWYDHKVSVSDAQKK